MISNLPTKTNVAARTAEGAKSCRLPVTGYTEQRFPFRGCEGCTKAAAHGPPTPMLGYTVPIGSPAIAGPTAEIPTADDMHSLRVALWAIYASLCPVPGSLPYNLGDGANNLAQQTTYEIMAASGRTLTLYGPNPKRITHGNSRLNPDWPSIDPETGESVPRLISDSVPGALPPGALVVFAWPSTLWETVRPWIERIDAPESDAEMVSFDVVCSINVGAARQAWDESAPPADGKFYCTLYYYFSAPEPHPNYQAYDTTHWAARSQTVAVGDIVDWSSVPLLNGLGAETRIYGEVLTVAIRGTAETLLDPPEIDHVDTGTGWQTRVDLSDYETDETITAFRFTFVAEATNETANVVIGPTRCVNSQVDRTESYIHDAATGRRCVNVACDAFDTFRGTCWKPNASGFSLGASTLPIAAADDSQWLSKFFHDHDITLLQSLPGVSSNRNFTFRRVGGPSLGVLCGGFQDEVFRGAFAAAEAWFLPRLGVRYIDDDGRQRVRTGLWQGKREHDANEFTPGGSSATAYSGWRARAGDAGTGPDIYPRGNSGRTNVATFTHTGNGMASRCQRSTGTEELYVTGQDIARQDLALDASIRGWL